MPRTPIAFVKKPARMPPTNPPMNTTYIVAIAVPRPRRRYGHDGLQHRPVIANAQAVSTACGMPRITNHTVLCVENCSGVKSADGRISAPTIASAFAGFFRYVRSKYAPTNGRNGTAHHAREAEDEAPRAGCRARRGCR